MLDSYRLHSKQHASGDNQGRVADLLALLHVVSDPLHGILEDLLVEH
jgi:hypothetical protein